MKSELQSQIEKDFIEVYKQKIEERISVLRMLKSAIKNSEIEKKSELTSDEIIAILKKEIKQRKDTILTYQKANRDEAIIDEQKEIDIISAYLPKQLNEDEIRIIVKNIIEETKANSLNQMGQVIGKFMKDHGSEADGGLVSQIVKEEIDKK